MASRVAGRRGRRKTPTVTRERRRGAQRRVQAHVRREIAEVVRQAVERALEAEVTELVGRERYTRRTAAPRERSGVACWGCGRDLRGRSWRVGSYRRTLLTLEAAVRIRVPRVGCICGGAVPLEFAALVPYQRGWGDVQERARQLAGLCLSLRDVREVLAHSSGQPVACSTLSGWVQQAAHLAEALRAGHLDRVPAVVLLDGLWVKLMVPTGELYQDRAGRRRRRVRRAAQVLLVAYGVAPATGERWVLDWELAASEDQAGWQRLLERLHERGLRADAGLELLVHDGSSGLEAALGAVHLGPGVLHQRCVFHVLRTLRDAVVGAPGMTREQKRALRRQVLQDAAPIWQSADPAEVQRRRRAFVQGWAATQPQAVAVLQRVFGATTAYLQALERGRERGETWPPQHLRTTSALERANRAFRQKVRQVGLFHSVVGLAAAVGLVLAHRHLGPAATNAQEPWTETLEGILLAA